MGHIIKGGVDAVAEPTARDKSDRLAGHPVQTSRCDTVVVKAVDDKPPAVRRCNKFNDMRGGRQVVPVTMPLESWLVCKG